MGYVVEERPTAEGDELRSNALAAMMKRMRTDKERERRVGFARIAAAVAVTNTQDAFWRGPSAVIGNLKRLG